MSPLYATLASIAVCVVAAALEGVCAGKDVKSHFATLKSPAYSPPLWIWYIIGVVYYVTFFFVLFRLFMRASNSSLGKTAIIIILSVMLANALWNYDFFRARSP